MHLAAPQWATPTIVDPQSIFVGNLPHSVDELALADKFKKHGHLVSVQLIRRAQDIPNHALLSFGNEIDAYKAVVKENDTLMDDTVIRVAIRYTEPELLFLSDHLQL
jgi:RNA recognition motif-containing protein